MQAPEQVPPVGKLILDAKVSTADRERLLSAFAVALDRVKGSDRVYTRTEFELLRTLTSALRAGNNAGVLVPAMRSYIVRQVSGPRCSENAAEKGPGASVRDFNALVDRLNASGADYKKISPEESKPSKDEGGYQVDEFGNRRGPSRFWKVCAGSITAIEPAGRQTILDAGRAVDHGVELALRGFAQTDRGLERGRGVLA